MDLNQYIQDTTGCSQGTIMLVLDALVKGISMTLRQGEGGAKVPGLGIFSFQDKPEREGRNPRTGESITIAASRKPNFKFDKKFVVQIQPDPNGSNNELNTEVVSPPPVPVDLNTEPTKNFPPPIPFELMESKTWHITKANGEYVELPESQMIAAGVTPKTPVWSDRTGWKLAKDIPSLAYLFPV